MVDKLELTSFQNISLNDPFFDSLKKDYRDFPTWYASKSTEPVFVQYSDDEITGFMYLKIEHEAITDIAPSLPNGKRLKIGTFKVDAHGTRLGDRLLKKAFDTAIVEQIDELYVTVFPRHKALIAKLKQFGFIKHGNKTTADGVEDVLIKRLKKTELVGDIRRDYPLINMGDAHSYLLAIRPEWHSKLFPDSLVSHDNYDLLEDVSYTNSISKTYICAMDGVSQLKPKDIMVIYRMNDGRGAAEYRSVATSICVAEEIRTKNDFQGISEYISYTAPYSVFSEQQLEDFWRRYSQIYVIKMLYNAAFKRRVIRKILAEEVGLDRTVRWGFVPISNAQLLRIAELGEVDGRLIVN